MRLPFGRSSHPLDESINDHYMRGIMNQYKLAQDTVICTSSHDLAVSIYVRDLHTLLSHGGSIHVDTIKCYLHLLHKFDPSIKYLKPQFSYALQGRLRVGIHKYFNTPGRPVKAHRPFVHDSVIAIPFFIHGSHW